MVSLPAIHTYQAHSVVCCYYSLCLPVVLQSTQPQGHVIKDVSTVCLGFVIKLVRNISIQADLQLSHAEVPAVGKYLRACSPQKQSRIRSELKWK